MCLFFFIGELLGVDYLLSQTGQPLKLNLDSEETEDTLEDVVCCLFPTCHFLSACCLLPGCCHHTTARCFLST